MRACGILMHISSLPSDYGIGTMGKEAYNFIDFLYKAHQTYWQILPICPTSYGDSPYQSFSTNAGNPYFIDFDVLCDEGLLKKEDYDAIDWGKNPERIDYETIYKKRFNVLKKAYMRFKSKPQEDFYKFLSDNEIWISNYALFMSIKENQGGKSWLDWDDSLKKRDPHSLWLFKESHKDEVEFWEFLQYQFAKQWAKLKNYANKRGIKIIGDIPIYVASDSADVWVYPDLFCLDENLYPKSVAGCPPDAFSEDGQLWGNPIYNWKRHKETNYDWWIRRIQSSQKLYDIIRIDHFRGFDEYYSIPFGDDTAVNGKWEQGPGADLFNAMKSKISDLNIIAEDLGFLSPSVKSLLQYTGFPGMKVLEFAFNPNSESDYLPHNHVKNCVVYTGTHDNAPIKAWLDEEDEETLDFCREYIGAEKSNDNSFIWSFIRAALSSVADTAIVQMQDYLALGKNSRMNTPSTSHGNWQWRMKKNVLTENLTEEIAHITQIYGRGRK